MKFLITMNMPSSHGSTVHQIIGEHPAESLLRFHGALSESDFLIVREWYRNGKTGQHFPVEETLINTNLVGKVRVFDPDR
jgi:hypothetical protein